MKVCSRSFRGIGEGFIGLLTAFASGTSRCIGIAGEGVAMIAYLTNGVSPQERPYLCRINS